MKNQDLIKSVMQENHVKFRSILNESLYNLLSEKISDKTFEMMSEIFNAEIIEEQSKKKKPDADGDGVPDWADKKPGEDDNAPKRRKMNEAKKDEEEEEKEEEDEKEEDEEDEEGEDEEEEEEDEEEKVKKKGGTSYHFDIDSHNEAPDKKSKKETKKEKFLKMIKGKKAKKGKKD